jgi:DUF1680 family protein
MKPDGSDWAKYTPLSGQRLEGSEQCGMGLNCCVASGPRGLFTFPLTSAMSSKEGLRVNFYAAGSYPLQTPKKQKIELIQETDYPETGKISMKVQIRNPESMSLQVRIPQWSKKTTLMVNGEPVGDVSPGKYVNLERKWKSGDAIVLNLDMRGRVLSLGEFPKNMAIVRGPVVLSRDTRFLGPAIESIIKPVTDKEGFIELIPAEQKTSGVWMAFNAAFIPESYAEGGSKPISIVFCDYASAGNSQEGNPYFRVWLPQLIEPAKLP